MTTNLSSFETRKCRLCLCNDLEIVIELNDSALCDDYLKVRVEQRKYPLVLNLCKKCGFVQLGHVVPPEIIYEDYIYFTKSSPGLTAHFKKYASEVMESLELGNNNLIIDIGSNDGTLLKYFKMLGQAVIGVEPSKPAAEIANKKKIKTYNNFFDSNLVKIILESEGKAACVTVNNLFANVVDLNQFIENIFELLSPDGVLIIESSYLISMLDNMVFDFIYHEHLSYLSVKPLKKWFLQYGLRLFNISKIGTKGGSLRYFVCKEKSFWSEKDSVKEFEHSEQEGVELEKKFFKFHSNIFDIKTKVDHFLMAYSNKRIVGYGASATSTTLISHFELNNYLTYLVDDNESKIGRFSPGFHIPVHNSNMLFVEKPDLIIILAWRFIDTIYPKIKDLGIPILVPLPVFRII